VPVFTPNSQFRYCQNQHRLLDCKHEKSMQMEVPAMYPNPIYTRRLVVLLGGALVSLAGYADSITIGGKEHSGVIVRESGTRYYIATPADGKAFSVEKSAVDAGSFKASDTATRAQLQREWEFNAGFTQRAAAEQRAALKQSQASLNIQKPIRITAPAGTREEPRRDYATGGMVDHIKLSNVPLREALDATLRPLNLTYETDGNVLFITTPDQARNESNEALQARAYALNAAAETLPKILVANPGGPMGGGGFTGGGGAGFGSGGIGQGAFGGNFGAGGMMGGGFGGGQGGFGGGFGGGGGTVQISNISQLFTTIDDRLVGETPAVIGMSVSGGPTPRRQNGANQRVNENGR
jgi:hypothetical protein